MIQGQRVMMDRGHYKGRPGVITAVYGNKCTVVLTDTPEYEKHPGVTIKNVTSKDFHRI